MPRRPTPDPAGTTGPPPPPSLALSTVTIGGEELVVLTFDAPATLQAAPKLGKSERDVLGLLLEGWSNEEIARHRGRSVRTVANQVRRLFEKFGVSSRAELAAVAGHANRSRG